MDPTGSVFGIVIIFLLLIIASFHFDVVPGICIKPAHCELMRVVVLRFDRLPVAGRGF